MPATNSTERTADPGLLTTRSEYDRLGRLHRRDVFTDNAQRPPPRRWFRTVRCPAGAVALGCGR